MTRKKDSAKKLDWKAMMAGQEDFLRPLIQAVVQQVLEAEMAPRGDSLTRPTASPVQIPFQSPPPSRPRREGTA